MPMTIGSGGFTGTTPPGSEIRRFLLIEGVRCLMDLHCSRSVGICGKTQQSSYGSPFKRRDGNRLKRLLGVLLLTFKTFGKP